MMNDLGITSYLAELAESKEKRMKDNIKKISMQIVGRLFRPKVFKGIIYEVHQYIVTSGEVILRRLFDQNQIILTKKNISSSNLKSIRGAVLFHHYEMLEQVQEMKIRHSILDQKDAVITVKFQVMDFDGQVECLPMEIKPAAVSL